MGDAESTNKIAADDCVDCEDDQPTSAVACCENCDKRMCAKHVDSHSKLTSCRHHVVVPQSHRNEESSEWHRVRWHQQCVQSIPNKNSLDVAAIATTS